VSDYLYADPDGIDKVAMPYNEAATNFQVLSGRLDELRSRYSNAWGNDSTGDQVRPQVEAALKQMQQQVDALGKALGMYHDGLKGTSKAYREADSAAGDAGRQFAGGMDKLSANMPPTSTGGDDTQYKSRDWTAATPALRREAVQEPDEEQEAEPRRALKSTHLLAREPAEPAEESGELVEGRRVMMTARHEAEPALEPAQFRAAEPGIPAEPAEPRQFYRSENPLLPERSQPAEFQPRIPGQPAEYNALIPAEQGIPAQYQPGETARYDALLPTEQGRVSEPLQPAQYQPAQYQPAQYREGIPLQPLLPTESRERGELIPAEPATPAQPTIPAQHEFYRSVDPREPAIPADPPTGT
jgi:uncharacterized protein YukE